MTLPRGTKSRPPIRGFYPRSALGGTKGNLRVLGKPLWHPQQHTMASTDTLKRKVEEMQSSGIEAGSAPTSGKAWLAQNIVAMQQALRVGGLTRRRGRRR